MMAISSLPFGAAEGAGSKEEPLCINLTRQTMKSE